MTTSNVFTFLRTQKKISAMLLATMLMWAAGLPLLLNIADAASVVNFSDTLSDSDKGMVSNHTIRYTMSDTGSLASGSGTFTIEFEAGFELPEALGVKDFDFRKNGADQNITGTEKSEMPTTR